jgi:hypothetical protein
MLPEVPVLPGESFGKGLLPSFNSYLTHVSLCRNELIILLPPTNILMWVDAKQDNEEDTANNRYQQVYSSYLGFELSSKTIYPASREATGQPKPIVLTRPVGITTGIS